MTQKLIPIAKMMDRTPIMQYFYASIRNCFCFSLKFNQRLLSLSCKTNKCESFYSPALTMKSFKFYIPSLTSEFSLIIFMITM